MKAACTGALLCLALVVSPVALPGEEAQAFLEMAESGARLQARAAELALEKAHRSDVEAFAGVMQRYRASQLSALASLRPPSGEPQADMTLEHGVILENLEPLDGREFAKRWAEVQLQALRQEVSLYREYLARPEPSVDLVRFAKAELPRLEDKLRRALELHAATR